MPRQPSVCWDRYSGRFRTRIKGRTYVLGTDLAKAHERFATLHRRLIGRELPGPEPITTAELIETWLKAHGFAHTKDRKVWTAAQLWPRDILMRWLDFEGETRIDDLDRKCLIRFHAWCEAKGWTRYSITHYITHATKVIRWANEQGLTRIVPKRPRMKPARYVPQDIEPSEIAAVLEALDSNKRLKHAAPLIRFILATGCRPGEARMLTWGQVRLGAKRCVLAPDEHKTGHQTGSARIIHLDEEAAGILESARPNRQKPMGYVFQSKLGKPYTKSGLRSIMLRLGTYPYALRHTWAQNAVDQGADLADVAKLMGHRSVVTTQKYAEVRSNRAVATLNSLTSPSQRALAAGPPPEKPADAASRKKPQAKRKRSQGKSATDHRKKTGRP